MRKLTTEDNESKSPDPVVQNIEWLKEIFPEAFAEGKVDFEVLKQLLDGAIDEREEKYGLNWHGKRRARQLGLTPFDWDTAALPRGQCRLGKDPEPHDRRRQP